MQVRFCMEMKTRLKKGQAKELYDKIQKYEANVIDLGTLVYITGKVSYPNLSAVLYECLAYGVVDCEVGVVNEKTSQTNQSNPFGKS